MVTILKSIFPVITKSMSKFRSKAQHYKPQVSKHRLTFFDHKARNMKLKGKKDITIVFV